MLVSPGSCHIDFPAVYISDCLKAGGRRPEAKAGGRRPKADGRRSKAGGRRPKWRPTSRSQVIGAVALSQSRLASESAGCNTGHQWSRLLACSRCSARIRHGVARAATNKGPSATLRHCCVVELASWLFSFFFFGFVAVLVVAAVNGRHASSSSASRRRSLADGDLTRRSGLLSLQSLFCTHSTWRRSRCIIKTPRGGIASLAL